MIRDLPVVPAPTGDDEIDRHVEEVPYVEEVAYELDVDLIEAEPVELPDDEIGPHLESLAA